MKSTAISAKGTKLYVSEKAFVTDGDTQKAVADAIEVNNLRSFKGFDGQATEVDVTNLSSDAKEYLVGLQDYGNLVIDVDRDFSDKGQQALKADKGGPSIRNFLLIFPNASAAKFRGFAKNTPLEGGVDQTIKSTGLTIRITGPVDIVQLKRPEETKTDGGQKKEGVE